MVSRKRPREPSTIVNEALEIARRFNPKYPVQFINSIFDSVARKLEPRGSDNKTSSKPPFFLFFQFFDRQPALCRFSPRSELGDRDLLQRAE